MDKIVIEPIAYIQTEFKEKFGIPRQSGLADLTEAKIIFTSCYRDKEALREIDKYSHIWLIFGFSEVKYDKWAPTVRPPRLGGNKKVGVFASRSPYRPNGLGLSCVKLLRLEETEKEGTVLVVAGADLLDGTPIYDIKPYLSFTDCQMNAVCGFADNVKDYALKVEFSKQAEELLDKNILDAVVQCISQDPRPSYQDEPERIYYMKYGKYDIGFKVEGGCASVISVKLL